MKFSTKIRYSSSKQLQNELRHHKVVHIQSPLVNCDLDKHYYQMLSELGNLVPMDEDLESGNKTNEFWTDIRYDSAIANSYRHSNTRQPLHTDGAYESQPPNISFFYCINKPLIGGATIFLNYDTLILMLKMYDPRLLQQLQQEFITFSKGNDTKTAVVIGNGKITWNYFRAEKNAKTECLIESFQEFLEHVSNMNACRQIGLNPGEAVIFWDDLVLHGRNAFLGERWLRKGGVKWIPE